VVAGVFLMITAVIGWLGVKFNYKVTGRYFLGIYVFLLCLIVLLEWIGAGILFTFTGRLDQYIGNINIVKDSATFILINASYAECCCNRVSCPNGSCWIPAALPYPCDDETKFATFLTGYVDARIEPVAIIALVLSFIQIFTMIATCCNQCRGRKLEEQKKIGGPLSYDGLYSEGEEAYAGYGYENYVKGGGASGQAPRPAGGAQAPKVSAGGAAAAPARTARPGSSAAQVATPSKK
jgi:hypothetical protein